ncbi:hypothetical protein [Clostridium sp. UBA4548]|uniref:hypothetical protein n=1 Tax=Clostridium sp. UBA4548 TaxID=1946361 RepID=UPI0025BC500D|nr:hypothetical protein [Clostridium sp. UBA4548]
MIDIKVEGKIKVYNDGVLIIEGNCYNEINRLLEKAIRLIQDAYQLNILNKILRELREVA